MKILRQIVNDTMDNTEKYENITNNIFETNISNNIFEHYNKHI